MWARLRAGAIGGVPANGPLGKVGLGVVPVPQRPPVPSTATLSERLNAARREISATMLRVASASLLVVGLLDLLEAAGWAPFPVFDGAMGSLWAMPVVCLVVAAAGFAGARVVARAHAPWVGGGVAVLMATMVAMSVPTHFYESTLPQAVWVPIIVALSTSDRRWSVLTLGLTVVLTYGLHGEAEALGRLITGLVALTLAALLFSFRDLHERALQAHDEMKGRADALEHSDPLTGAPNRLALRAHLTGLSGRAAAEGGVVGVIVVGVDGLLSVNSALGAAGGDAVLVALAQELRALLRADDLVARLGGDQFGLVVGSVPDVAVVERIADAALQLGRVERLISGRPTRCTLSVGVAVCPSGAGLGDALRRAEQALRQAKQAGRDQVVFASSELQAADQRRYTLSSALREALPRHQLHLVYQPIVDLRTGELRRAEALLRWTHPELGVVSPAEFIPVAEANGLIHEIGDWVFQEAASQVQRWRAEGAAGFQVSVNRSPLQFLRDPVGPHRCVQQLEAMGLAADAVAIELTEGVLIDSPAAVEGHLRDLRRAGVALCLDDFGTGYSSLSRLHALELDVLKIDRSFVMHLRRGSKEHLLCQGIVQIAQSLGLRVVAEGVETEQQRALLVEMGCDYGQGWLFGRPVRAEDLQNAVLKGTLATVA